MVSTVEEIRTLVQHRVGAFFRNCHTDDACTVCYGPVEDTLFSTLCQDCERHQQLFGSALADTTVILTYAQGWMPEKHQSAHVVRAYKDMNEPRARDDMRLVVLAAMALHHSCMRNHLQRDWDAVAYVPSERVPHPVAALAAIATLDQPNMPCLKLRPGPGFSVGSRTVREDRFTLADTATVSGTSVLLIDDTWVSGAKLQSAAVTLKNAGAHHVTGLCVARWLSWRNAAHQSFIKTRLGLPYDPTICPVISTGCHLTR